MRYSNQIEVVEYEKLRNNLFDTGKCLVGKMKKMCSNIRFLRNNFFATFSRKIANFSIYFS